MTPEERAAAYRDGLTSQDSPPTYDKLTGAGGHCLDTDAEHWYDGEACGHCSAEWVDD